MRFKWIPGSIWGLSTAVLLLSISVTMTFSISPFFMTKVLGISLMSLGIIEGFTEGLAQISKLFSGVTSDMFRKKKPTLMVGFLLSVLSKPLFILANGVGLILASKIMERISNGVMATPRDAFVADESPQERKGACFGVMMTFKTIGCTIGSWLIAYLLGFTDDYRMLLWLGFVTSVASIFVLQFFMKEQAHTPSTASSHKSENIKISWDDIKELNFNYWSILGVAVVFMCARFSDGFLILRLKELGGSESLCASVIGTFNVVSALCCFPIGYLSDRIDRARMLYFAFIALFLCNLCFVFAQDIWLGMVGVLLWGAQRGTSQILFVALMSDEASKKITGTAIGLFYITTGVIALVAGSFAGWLADTALSLAFVFGAVVSGVAMILLFLRKRVINHRKRRHLRQEALESLCAQEAVVG